MRWGVVSIAVFLSLASTGATLYGDQGAPSPAGARALDFQVYRARVEPILLARRGEHARCYACHSQGTPLRLQELSPGASSWTEEQSRANFAAIQRVVVPGQPTISPLVLMPLAHQAGGTEFHPGGKHFASMDDPELKIIVAWINGAQN